MSLRLGSATNGAYTDIGGYQLTQAFSEAWIGSTGFYPVCLASVVAHNDPVCYLNLLNGEIIHPIFSLNQIARPPDEVLVRRARGGLLCDEPGLGKSITLMAVILRSLGTRTVPLHHIIPPAYFDSKFNVDFFVRF